MPKYILFLLCLTLSCAEKRIPTIASQPEKAVKTDISNKNDTLFILREVTPYSYYAVYIDTTRKSKEYEQLLHFQFNKYEQQAYQENYQFLKKEMPNAYQNTYSMDISKEWLPVYLYENDYYLYAPCDWGNVARRSINDSSFVYWFMDGPLPIPIHSVERVNEKKHILKVKDYMGRSSQTVVITIYEVDAVTQLSVFHYHQKSDDDGYELNYYQLYVPKNKAHYFDLIINDCRYEKEDELNFEEVDFQKLIERTGH